MTRIPGGQPDRSSKVGQLGDPGPVTDLVVCVVSRLPDLLGDQLQQLGGAGREGEPDRVGQPLAGHPLHDVVGAAGGIGTDEHLAAGTPPGTVAGQLAQRIADEGDVVGGGVGAGVPRAQQEGEGFPAALSAVVDEGAQRVESVSALERRSRPLLVGVRSHQRGIHIDDQRRLGAGGVVWGVLTGQRPCPRAGRGPGRIDRPQRRGSLSRQSVDRARDRRVGGHRSVEVGFGAQQRDVRQGVPAQRQAQRQVGDDLGRIVHRQRLTPRRQEKSAGPVRWCV